MNSIFCCPLRRRVITPALLAVSLLLTATARATILVNDTFDVGGSPTVGDDAADPLDTAWTAYAAGGTLSVVDDTGGLGSGNALDGAVLSGGGVTALSLPSVNLAINQTIILSFDFRYITSPANNSLGFRFGLLDQQTAGETNDRGYGGVISTGTDTTGFRIYEDTGTSGSNEGLAGADFGSLGATGPGSTSVLDDTLEHSFSLQITRTSATDVSLVAEVDGQTITATDSTGAMFTFNQILIRNGAIGTDFRFDNVQLEVIPEPSTMLLLGVGGLLIWRRARSGK